MRAAVAGFRVKSGRAVAVLLGGARQRPLVLAREVLPLAGDDAGQPYHAAVGTLETDERRLRSRLAAIRRTSHRTVGALLRRWAADGATVTAAALVAGSLRAPETIANPHVRAHALEGLLFRSVLAAALEGCGVSATVVAEREVMARAGRALGRSESALAAALAGLGRTLGPPWRADHKLAAAAAWALLA